MASDVLSLTVSAVLDRLGTLGARYVKTVLEEEPSGGTE